MDATAVRPLRPGHRPRHRCWAGAAGVRRRCRRVGVLWVTDPNPRAQAFYRKHGFVPDGATQVQDGVREIRMVRRNRQDGPPAS
ncbi:GNAT family N-acetyltransferase [Mumia zhuanghuii]|uniref:GNAT family N-acetyltransferase n=1 Tax=Mumia zhuanghuii TaxID=2585211 RepID=UPI002B2658CC|nr:GNAT family N-acetyltransferase [Mumia zhuanghuii]